MATLHPTLGLVVLAEVQKFFPKAILAGGYLRDTLTGRTPKDIDVFIPSPEPGAVRNFESVMKCSPDSGAAEYMDRGEVAAIWTVPGFAVPVQVISLKPGLCPVDRARNHDFGICQVWHDGTGQYMTEIFAKDLANRTFTLAACEDSTEFARSMRRWDRLKEKFPEWALVILDEFSHYHEATFR